MKKSILNIGLLLTMLAVVNFTSCKGGDEPDKPFVIKAENVLGKTSDVATVKIVDWNYSKYPYTFDVIAQAPFVNKGFTLTLPAIVADKHLFSIDDEDMPEGVTISDKNAKIFGLEWLDAFDKDGEEIGYFMFGNSDNDGKIYFAVWMYTDRDVSIIGKGRDCYYDDYYDEEWCFEAELNVNLKKGWNVVYVVDDEINDIGLMTTQKPAGVTFEWYYESSDWYSLSTKTKSLKSKKSIFGR